MSVLSQASSLGAPAELLQQIRDAAFSSFLDASHVTAFISAAVVGIAAIVVGFALPTMRPPKDERIKPEAPEATVTLPTDVREPVEEAQVD
jgi:ABC-type sulfate transport system permease component